MSDRRAPQEDVCGCRAVGSRSQSPPRTAKRLRKRQRGGFDRSQPSSEQHRPTGEQEFPFCSPVNLPTPTVEAQGPTKGSGCPPGSTSQEPSRQGHIHCFHLPARSPCWGGMRAVLGLSCSSHHCSSLGAPGHAAPRGAASPLCRAGSQMCESVAQGNSQPRACGRNAEIWVSPRHHREGSGQREQPRWLPTGPGERDGGTEAGPCCPSSGLGTADAASLPILQTLQGPFGASMMQPQRCQHHSRVI